MVLVVEVFESFAIGCVQLLIGLMLALLSAYVGLKVFDRMTKNIEEIKELKKGNVAVGILMGAIILSLASIVQSGVVALNTSIIPGMGTGAIVVAFAIGLINLVIGLLVAVIAIYIAIFILDKITTDIDEWEEIKRGNVAIAILMSAILFAVSFVVQSGVYGITRALDARVIAKILGF